MSICQHFKRIGDNYGISCQTCGDALEGYGFGGSFGSNHKENEHCIHVWLKTSAEQEECMYCYRMHEREKKAN
jgi:hypothetical protein